MTHKVLRKITVSNLTLLVLIIGVLIALYEAQTIKRELQLNLTEVRPFVMLKPAYNDLSKTPINIGFEVANTSPTPGRLIYLSVTDWFNGHNLGTLHSAQRDVLYNSEAPVQFGFTTLDPNLSEKFHNGTSTTYYLGACAVYEPLSEGDPRRWEVYTLYLIKPTASAAILKGGDETEVSQGIKTCDSSAVFGVIAN